MPGLLEGVLDGFDFLLEVLYLLRRKALFLISEHQRRGGRGYPLRGSSKRETRVRVREYPSVATMWVRGRTDEQ
jgi:hypothetical protein